MERLFLHIIQVTKPKQKYLFHFKLPENTEAITGIGVSSDRYKVFGIGTSKIERSAGTLQLFAADTGEHLFSDNPKNTFDVSDIQKLDEKFEHEVWSYKSSMCLLDTWQPIHTTIIDGYYHDLIGNVTEEIDYEIRIYLRLQFRKQ